LNCAAGGGAAGQTGRAAGGKAFFVCLAVRPQLLDVAVCINAAGHHIQSAGVQSIGPLQPLTDRGNATIAHADIRSICIGGGDHRAATNHQVELRHHWVPSAQIHWCTMMAQRCRATQLCHSGRRGVLAWPPVKCVIQHSVNHPRSMAYLLSLVTLLCGAPACNR
jgi:hypothetical protein